MAPLYTLHEVDTRDSEAVCAVVVALEKGLFSSEATPEATEAVFHEVVQIFDGHLPFFQRIDTVYHNLEHTLQATLCWARIFRGYRENGGSPQLTHAHFRLGLASVLLHDLGYLKEEHDELGTGAKFTFVHERRSCELAQIYLSERGWSQPDIFAVQHMISCTGPRAIIDAIPFRHRAEKVLGQMLCTADYLGQMSDPDYLAKLPILFKEFEESDNYRGIPKERRLFGSVESLIAQTPVFWNFTVLPKLEYDCGGLFRYLAIPYPDGPNPYLDQVALNLAQIQAILS